MSVKFFILVFIAGVVWYKLKTNEARKENLIRLIAANESYTAKKEADKEYVKRLEVLNEQPKRRLNNLKIYEGLMLLIAFIAIEVLIFI